MPASRGIVERDSPLFPQRVYICPCLNKHEDLSNVAMRAGEIQWPIPECANLIDISQRITKSRVVIQARQHVCDSKPA